MELIGNTPLVKLRNLGDGDSADVYVKFEGANPTGSMKDRMALSMIKGAERRGDLRPGGRVVEYTGGSTGSSLAMVCATRGYKDVAANRPCRISPAKNSLSRVVVFACRRGLVDTLFALPVGRPTPSGCPSGANPMKIRVGWRLKLSICVLVGLEGRSIDRPEWGDRRPSLRCRQRPEHH